MELEQRESLLNLFSLIYKENKEASELSIRLMDMAHTLDDLIDKDKPVEDNNIYSFAMGALFELQRFPLYAHCGLYHHLLNVFLRWRDANTIEADPDRTGDDLNKCYMLRAGIYDIFVVIAYYLHGEAWATKVGPVVRRYYGDTLKSYKDEIGICQTQSLDRSQQQLGADCSQRKEPTDKPKPPKGRQPRKREGSDRHS